jgi:hypothetical protein
LSCAEGFAYQAPQAIAPHGISSRFHGDSQSHAGEFETVGFDPQTKEPVVDAAAGSVDRIELRLAAQAFLGTQSKAAFGGLHGGPQNQTRERAP